MFFLYFFETTLLPFFRYLAHLLLPRPIYNRLVNLWSRRWGKRYYELLAIRGWDNYIYDPRMDAGLRNMIREYQGQKDTTSNFWIVLNRKNIKQLLDYGFENIKQTIGLNYFIWLIHERDPYENAQVKFLINHVPFHLVVCVMNASRKSNKHNFLTQKQSDYYNFVTFLLWVYMTDQLNDCIIDTISEPLLGNPPCASVNGRLVSQDLANSLLEYQSISLGVDVKTIKSVMELGAGYGRTAYVLLTLNQKLKYTIVDIPPALYVSQRYLTTLFPNADLTFIMPHQLKQIPDKSVDLFLAINCLHEIRPEHIKTYFDEVDRLSYNFYFTCWKEANLPYEDIVIKQKDYPVKSNWDCIYNKTRRVQTDFFEAFYKIRG